MSNRNNNFIPTPMNQQSMLGYTASDYMQPVQSQLHSTRSSPDIRGGSPNSRSSFQERMIPRPFDSVSIPSESPSSVRRLDDELGRNTHTYPSWPRHITTHDQLAVLPRPQVDDSRLYNVQQKKALDKLKKSTYNPVSKGLISTKTNLYYRDLPVNEKGRARDDGGGKRCAICLEDFEPRQEVMLTPCNHMFHEECIVPWAKSNGQCPVCRFAFAEKITRESSTAMQPINNNTTAAYLWATHGLTIQDLISILMIS